MTAQVAGPDGFAEGRGVWANLTPFEDSGRATQECDSSVDIKQIIAFAGG
jgi:hypothetical protein